MTKFEVFKGALLDLCLRHDVLLTTQQYEALVVYDLEDAADIRAELKVMQDRTAEGDQP